MPTNVPPQYKEAEARYRAARTPEEKLEALEEMLRIMPKHKGTDKLQADLKTKIAKLRKEPQAKGGAASHSFVVPREGAGQVALLGPPNAGKSALLDRLTHAEPKVADYPFTTREPLPGMMLFEDVAIQLVDLPPLSSEHTEPWVFDAARRADLVWLVAGIDRVLEDLEEAVTLLRAKKIEPLPEGTKEFASLEPGWVAKQCVFVVTGADKPGAAENLEVFRELSPFPGAPRLVSCTTGDGLASLPEATFRALDLIRIYTKEPGKPADLSRPFTLPRGATVGELAAHIHKELVETLKFARVWGEGVFDGQQVQRDHVLHEGNVVELHA